MRVELLALALLTLTPTQAATPSITVSARSLQPGELALVTITVPASTTTVSAQAFGRSLPATRVDDGRWEVLVGIDLDVTPGRHTFAADVMTAGRLVRATKALVVTAKRFPTRRLTVDDAFVNPPPEVQTRIAEEASELNRLWTQSAPERLWSGPFEPPVPQPANSAFGTRSVFNGQPRSPHGGADFPSPAGTPVRAPAGGRVVLARDLYYTGQTVVIDHGLGLVSLFAHLSRLDVTAGQQLATGDSVGLVGATGRVTGPHLHWTVRAATARVDPLSLLAILGPSQKK